MGDIHIRRATVDDMGDLAESSAALFAEDGATRDRLRDRGWPEICGAQWCAGLVADPSTLVLLAAADAGIVGHLIGTFAEPSAMWIAPRAELISTFVSTGWRGQGVGTRLVENFLAWGRVRGASRLHVSAYVANQGAVRFYRRHGFAPLSVDLVIDL